jgi:hypothetical protein
MSRAYRSARGRSASPRIECLILTHILQIDSVDRPLKPMSMEEGFTTPAILIRSISGPKKMWVGIRHSMRGFMTGISSLHIDTN